MIDPHVTRERVLSEQYERQKADGQIDVQRLAPGLQPGGLNDPCYSNTFNAAAATCSSSDEVNPLTPTPPSTSPSASMGSPP